MIIALLFLAGVLAFFANYKFIWTHIGGRPWTYIIRDFSYDQPFLLALIFFLAGIIIGPNWHWPYLLPIGLGVLAGHLYFGTKWIHGESVHQWIFRRRK